MPTKPDPRVVVPDPEEEEVGHVHDDYFNLAHDAMALTDGGRGLKCSCGMTPCIAAMGDKSRG
jgi:hypothetical protein